MADRVPAWHHENILRSPLNHLVTYARATTTLHWHEHSRIGRTIAAGGKTLWEQLDEGAHRRHGIIAIDRIGVSHLDPMTGIPFVAGFEFLERFTSVGVGIVEN